MDKRLRLPIPVLDRLSEITGNLGILMIGSVVIPAAFDKGSPEMIVLGLAAAILCWIVAVGLSWRKQ